MSPNFPLSSSEKSLNLSQTHLNLLEIFHHLQIAVSVPLQNFQCEPVYLYLKSSCLDEKKIFSQEKSHSIGKTLKYYHFVFMDFNDFQNTLDSILDALYYLDTGKLNRFQLKQKFKTEIQQIYPAKGMYWSKTLMLLSNRSHQLLIESPKYYNNFMQYLQT